MKYAKPLSFFCGYNKISKTRSFLKERKMFDTQLWWLGSGKA